MATAAPNDDQSKTAIIVGASRGLGLGLAREFARRGWQVTATARNAAAANELADAVVASDGRIAVEEVDIDRAESVDALATRLAGRRFGLVFINAGVAGPQHQSADVATPQEVGALMYTNAVAPIRLARRLLPLIADGGTLAFMSSNMGSVADNLEGGMELYRASKAALNSLTRGFVATDVGDRPIAVLTMHPGWVRTAMGGADAPLAVEERAARPAIASSTTRALNYHGKRVAWTEAAHEHQSR